MFNVSLFFHSRSINVGVNLKVFLCADGPVYPNLLCLSGFFFSHLNLSEDCLYWHTGCIWFSSLWHKVSYQRQVHCLNETLEESSRKDSGLTAGLLVTYFEIWTRRPACLCKSVCWRKDSFISSATSSVFAQIRIKLEMTVMELIQDVPEKRAKKAGSEGKEENF